MFTRFSLLTILTACLMLASSKAADNPVDKTRKLVAILQSNAPFFDKARACQQLGEFGTPDAVPALAALLADEHLGAYARSGLEGIPHPSAAEALRNAAATLKGNQLAGVVNSLGVLRDPNAVGLLRKLADDPASGVVREALLALGRISSDEAMAFLRQALTAPPDTTRADAAAGCLLAAEKQLADGRTQTAAAIYDAVRKANVPPGYRAAAVRGAIVALKSDGIPLLIEQLRSDDRLFRNAALIAIREIPCDPLASVLNTELNRASTERQVQLLTALIDCHNAQSLAVIEAKSASEDPEVRKTAMRTLGRIAGPGQAGVLLNAVAQNRNAEESAVALDSLRRISGSAVDPQIVAALNSTPNADARIQFIRLLESRGATNTAGEILKQAADSNPKVSLAAFRALKSLAGPRDLGALITLTRACTDASVREAAESAVAGACSRTGSSTRGTEAVLLELTQASDPIAKNSWIRILASLADPRALPAILEATRDPNEIVAVNAIEQLAAWPDPAPVDHLLEIAERGTNPRLGKRALTSAIQLASNAAEEGQRPAQTMVKWFQRASQVAATTTDRRLIISGLGRLKHIESFRLLVPYLDQKELQNEAAVAVIQIAPTLRQEDPTALQAALQQIIGSTATESIRRQAQATARTLSAQVKRTPLFDGRSLDGWQGDTNVWRVRDGVIVGGSIDGNPRNEFLATVRPYTNFILRLDYKLVGTEGFVNGGVQFRSVRVKQPPNEMSGFQADIGAGYSGCLYDESRRNKFLVQADKEQVKRLEKPGDWNHYEVICAGPRIRITLQGQKMVDYSEPDSAIPSHGLIALQIHGNCKAEISFRNITIEELSP